MPGLLLALSLAPPARAASPATVGFQARVEAAGDLAADRPAEDSLETVTRLSGRARGELSGGARWFLAVDGMHALRWGADPELGDLEAQWEVRPGESGWEGPVGPARLKAGLLVERWGKLDLLPVVDVLNPRDIRFGPLTPMELSRVPVALARLQLGGERARVELVAIPFAGADRASTVGTDWSLLRQGAVPGLLDEASGWEGDALTEPLLQELAADLSGSLSQADPSVRQSLDSAMGGVGLPQALIANGEVALRLEGELPGADGALLFGALRNHQPALSLDPAVSGLLRDARLPGLSDLDTLGGALPLDSEWPRTWMAGMEGSTAVGPVGLRAEGRWLSARVVRMPWLSATTSPSLAGGLGLDVSPATWLYLSVEGRVERLLNPPDELWLDQATRAQSALALRLNLFADRVQVEGAAVYDWGFHEHLLRPVARWRASDAVAVELGALLLGGGPAAEAPPATLRDSLAYSGGPLSFWGDNDCVTAAFTWIR